MIRELARWAIFGANGGGRNQQPGLWAALLGDLLYAVGIKTGMPSTLDYVGYYADMAKALVFGFDDDQLPGDLPIKLYDAVERTLLSRGGKTADGAPNFVSTRQDCAANPLMWTVFVKPAVTVDPDKLFNYETSLEEALTRIGYDVNVRIMRRPLRIEIDRPTPPAVMLSDYWMSIGTLPRNELWSVPGVSASDKGLVLFSRKMEGDSYSAMISGKSGAGKTQLALAMLLSMAYTNSPAMLSMVVIDPKVIDMTVLSSLPHMARSVVTDSDESMAILDALVAEMESRKRRLERGDRSFLGQYIMLYIDEMADLLASVADKDRVISAVQRLSQKGRAYGFIVIGATQRVWAVDARMYGNLNDKYALSANNGSDGFAATGVAGVQVHKLPSRGACELYPDGVRLQGFFVADSKRPDYEEQIGRFIRDIRNRWIDARPCWTVEPVAAAGGVTFSEFIDSLRAIDGLTENRVRAEHKRAFGRGIGYPRAKEILGVVEKGGQ